MESDRMKTFGIEMKARFEAFTAWAIDQWPDTSHPLARTDFDVARKEIETLAEGRQDIGERNAEIPEPSENGPQYVNVNPTPWP